VVVQDSPEKSELDARGALSTPRRMRASMALRKKTSFYSGMDKDSKFILQVEKVSILRRYSYFF
jgi:hypothetical protein